MTDRLKESRLKLIAIIFGALFLILIVGAFRLMIVQGDEYREISDNKRIKEVEISAPRGNIYDRNGKLLAGNRSSFLVQLRADEIDRRNRNEVNRDLIKLIKVLEEDGVDYIFENPIDLNIFAYRSEIDFTLETYLPADKVVNIIIDNDLMPEILKLYSSHRGVDFTMAARAISALRNKGIDIPVDSKIDKGVKFSVTNKEAYKDLVEANDLEVDSSAEDLILELVGEDKTVIKRIVSHPKARLLVYDLLLNKNLQDNIILQDKILAYDRQYYTNKFELNKIDSRIKLDSNPKEDFVNLVERNSLHILVQSLENRDSNLLLPGEILISMIEQKTKEELNIVAIPDLENEKVKIEYKNDDVSTDERPIDILIRKAKESGVLFDFITDNRIKFLAQDSNTIAGILPNISVLEWDYTYVKAKSDMLEKYGSKSNDSNEVLNSIKDYYEISIEDDFESTAMISFYREMEEQGFLSYQPVNVSKGISDSAVSKIEELIPSNQGIQVSAEPVRFYPEGTRAAHVLGYMGSISQPNEIQAYIKESGYSPDDLIGKTGVEESFERVLKGVNGSQRVEVDSLGNTTKILDEQAPIKGNSLYLTLDRDLQETAENALSQTLEKLRAGENFESKWGEALLRTNESQGRPHYNANSGSVVVLDVNTGEVLALANETTYDPNLFSTGISESDWNSLFPQDDENPLADRPLLNIAMQTQVNPGSIFKPVTSLTALEKGISPDTSIECSGYIDMGDHTFGCWIWNQQGGAHGYENMYEAIRDSCNYYYYVLALGENPQTGEAINIKVNVDDVRKTAIKLGLDEPTGIEINIPYEASGTMPNPSDKIQTIKLQVQDFLYDNLEGFLLEGVGENPLAFEELVRQIVDMTDKNLSRDDLFDRLEEMGVDIEKTLDNGETLVDRLKYTYFDQSTWSEVDMLNVVIGQGQNSYTPLQMANSTAIFANGGYKNKVSIIKQVKSPDDSKILLQNEAKTEKIDLNNYNHLSEIGTGMNMASHFGTIESVFGHFPIEVALKTGTAERGGINPETGEGFDDYSWMIAFAPYDNPEIAICTLLYQSGSGSNGAGIVREIVGEYMGLDPDWPTDEEVIEDEYTEDDLELEIEDDY